MTDQQSEMSEIDRFLAWRDRLLEEHKDEPEWQEEIWAFFLDLYYQTYPARTFQFVMELWGHYWGEGKERKGSKDEDVRES